VVYQPIEPKVDDSHRIVYKGPSLLLRWVSDVFAVSQDNGKIMRP